MLPGKQSVTAVLCFTGDRERTLQAHRAITDPTTTDDCIWRGCTKGNPGSVPALDDDHAHGGMSGRDAATKTRPSPRPVAEGMTRDEIVAAEPIPATEPIPEDLVQRFRQFDGVELGCDNGLLRPDEPPHGDEPGALGYRPAWLTQT